MPVHRSHGNELLNTVRIRREQVGEGNDPKILDYWTPQNQDTDQPAMYDGKYREDHSLLIPIFLAGTMGKPRDLWKTLRLSG